MNDWKCAVADRPKKPLNWALYTHRGIPMIVNYDGVSWRRGGCRFDPQPGDKWAEIILPEEKK